MILFIALAIVAACGQSDGGGGVFPDWLVLIENKVDFEAVVAAADLEETVKSGALQSIARLEYASFIKDGVDLSSILVYVYREKGETLFALKPVSLEPAGSWNRGDWSIWPNELGQVVKETVGGFLSGGWELDPTNLAADPSPVPAGSPPWSALVFSGGENVRNFMVTNRYDDIAKKNYIDVTSYDEDFIGSAGPLSHPIGFDVPFFRLLDAEYAGGKYRLLFVLQKPLENWPSAYVFSFGDEASFMSTASFFAADGTPAVGPEVTGPLRLDNETAWLTADGVVTLEQSSGFRLIRYDYGTSGTIQDEFLFSGDTESLNILSFDPSGTWWFMFDSWTGDLYKLRTWW